MLTMTATTVTTMRTRWPLLPYAGKMTIRTQIIDHNGILYVMHAHFMPIYFTWRFVTHWSKLPKQVNLCRRMGTWLMAHGFFMWCFCCEFKINVPGLSRCGKSSILLYNNTIFGVSDSRRAFLKRNVEEKQFQNFKCKKTKTLGRDHFQNNLVESRVNLCLWHHRRHVFVF